MLQNDTIFGIPFIFIGLGCFVLAAVLFVVWPKTAAKNYKQLSFRHYALHYFHTLAWILFGMSVIVIRKSPLFCAIFALLGIVVYVTFISIWAQARRLPQPAEEKKDGGA